MRLSRACFAAIAFFLVSLTVQTFGELVVLRHEYSENSQNTLTCISEDENSAALIWNYDVTNSPKSIKGFTPWMNESGKVNCSVRNAKKCLAKWDITTYWKVENSAGRSMGPIFDHRWEDLREFGFKGRDKDQKYQEVGMVKRSSGSIWFSARGERAVQIHMCKDRDPTADGPCIDAMIASFFGQKPGIKSCPGGLPKSAKFDENCSYIGRKVKREAGTVVNLYDWRTFRIQWDTDEGVIKVFKNNETSKPFLNGNKEKIELPEKLWVSVRGHESSRVRFHLYDYYYTETENAVITTKWFVHSGKLFRAELMVSLCEKCKIKIVLLNRGNHIKTWEASAEERNLLSWQLVPLTTTLDDAGPRYLTFTIESILDGNRATGRWAIDTFRIYKSGEKTRRSDLIINRGNEKVTCQKLSYNGSNEIVDSNFWRLDSKEVKSQLQEFIREHKEQDIGKMGFMCNPNGCTCGKGFAGYHCESACQMGRYGYNCAEYCGSCQASECDKKTGFCQRERGYHKIVPFCDKELNAPTFENVGDKTVMVIQIIDLDADLVKSVEVHLEEQPKKQNEETIFTFAERKSKGNTSIYESQITGLKLSTVYAVYTVVFVTLGDQSSTDSPRKNFSTTCHGRSKFEVVPAEKSLTVLSWNEDCPIETYEEKYYEVIVTSKSTSQTVPKSASFGSVPFTMSELEPATNYTVKIKDSKVNLEWDLPDIQTLESAPSKVKRLEAKSTNTTVTISWKPPSNPGGNISHYGVSIMLSVQKGCEDFDVDTPHKEAIELNVTRTTITFENLTPYAKYVVNVSAYNSEKGISDERWIDTKSNPLPASKVKNLRFNKTRNFIEWDYPDCTTVTGSAKVHSMLMKRKGATEWNKEWLRRREAKLNYNLREFTLDPFEEYTVRVYVVRSYTNLNTNESSYAEVNFTSNPAAPPAVRDLTMYNTDPVKNTVSLRWKRPEPANGELEGYMISVKDNGQNYRSIRTNGREDVDCNHQKAFLCYGNLELPQVAGNNDLRVEVFAQNKDVEKFGKSTALPIRREIFEQAPNEPRGQPEVYASRTPGGVTVKWWPPWYSPTKISSYSIKATFVWTHLLDETVLHKTIWEKLDATYPEQEFYTKELSLIPSTVYNISIASVNQRGISSREVSHYVFQVQDSIGLDGKLELRQESESSIGVRVPKILNPTKNTWAYIIVEGMRSCDYDHSQKPSPKNGPLWVAEKYQVQSSKEQSWSVSANSYSDKSLNCYLRIGETYTISIRFGNNPAARAANSGDSSAITLINEIPQKSNLAWLVVVPILAIFVVILFVVKYRKRNKCPLIDSARTGSDAPIPWELKETPAPKPRPRPRPTPDLIPCHPLSNPVSIEDFEEYTKDGLKSGLLSSQYREFPKGLTKPCDYGRLPENAPKNRWANLTAYDETRVVLKTLPDDPHSDYINASYIPGYQNERAYIATQGPKPETVNDFWRMIWQEKVRVICMLANVMEHGRMKCAQYWPEIGDEIHYGGILVSNMTQVVFMNYTIRTFGLTFKKKQREVTHLHYTGWPDHGVPMFTQSVVPYLKKLQSMATGNEPIVVHCSAGVGRTGTIILCDYSLRQAKYEMIVDLAAMTGRMRKYRARMVDNEQQYVFAHLAIVEYMLSEQTEIPCNEYSTGRINETRKLLISHIKRVRNIIWGERVMQSIDEPTSSLPDDVVQDEVTELNLADPTMGLFGPIERSKVDRNHMQTVSIDGFKIENQFLVTWLPSPSTRSKVWELIADDNIELVIVLQTPDEKDPTCCDLMPSESDPISSRSLQVEFKGRLEEDEDCRIDKVSVTKTSEISEDPQSVTVITCQGWGQGLDGKPPPVGALVSLWMASEKVSRSESPTLVLCHDGVMGCGMYVALSFLLERISVEKECDVICAVRKVRRSKPEFGQSIEQFEYLYDAALNYVDRFKLYSNYS